MTLADTLAGSRIDGHFVYIFRGIDCVLYVGETENPKQRFAEHRRSKEWWQEFEASGTQPEVRQVQNREVGLAMEALLIQSLNPVHNQRRPEGAWLDRLIEKAGGPGAITETDWSDLHRMALRRLDAFDSADALGVEALVRERTRSLSDRVRSLERDLLSARRQLATLSNATRSTQEPQTSDPVSLEDVLNSWLETAPSPQTRAKQSAVIHFVFGASLSTPLSDWDRRRLPLANNTRHLDLLTDVAGWPEARQIVDGFVGEVASRNAVTARQILDELSTDWYPAPIPVPIPFTATADAADILREWVAAGDPDQWGESLAPSLRSAAMDDARQLAGHAWKDLNSASLATIDGVVRWAEVLVVCCLNRILGTGPNILGTPQLRFADTFGHGIGTP